jgi:hypothetical protein
MAIAGCGHHASPRLSEEDAIKLAARAAEDAGFNVADYNAPRLYFDKSQHRGGKWWISYGSRKGPVMIGCLTVEIEDKTGNVQVWPGE